MKVKSESSHFILFFDENDALKIPTQYPAEVVNMPVKFERTGDIVIVAYCTHDKSTASQFDSDGLAGRIEPICINKDTAIPLHAVLLDEMRLDGARRLRISSDLNPFDDTGDVSHQSHVWLPSEIAEKELSEREQGVRASEIQNMIHEYLAPELYKYNAWLAGDIWGVCVEVIDMLTMRPISAKVSWGNMGRRFTISEMRDQFNHEVTLPRHDTLEVYRCFEFNPEETNDES